MTNDQRRQPGGDSGGGSSGGETPGGSGDTPPLLDRYGIADLAVYFITIGRTLEELGPDIARAEGSALIDRGLALDRVLKGAQANLAKTRHHLKNAVMEALARGNAQE